MSVGKRATRTGVAVFALGFSLAGPQAAGIATADDGDGDVPSVSGPQQATAASTPRKTRSTQPADISRPRGTHQNPAASTVDPAQSVPAEPIVESVKSRVARRQSDHRQSEPNEPNETLARPAAASAAAANTLSPASNDPAGVTTVQRPAVVLTPSPAAVIAPKLLANHPVLARIFSAPRPPSPATPIATLSAAVTTFFDSTANWVTGLPGGQVTQFLEGALLLVRRTLFNLFPALNTGQSTGQTDADCSACFTEAGLKAYLLEMAKQRYGGLFGTTVPVYGYGPYGTYPEYLKTEGDVTSDTNTQVDGVDEADFVENDGDYIYTAHNGQLTITRADDLSVASQSNLSGDVAGEYLSGDRLTVITQSGGGWYGPMVKMAYPGYWGPWKPQTTVTVYDVTDRNAPTVVSQTVFDGAYESSRSVDGVVYVVMQRSVNLPAPRYTETPIVYVKDPVLQADPAAASMIRYDPNAPIAYRTYETWDEYVARVGDDIVDLSLPHAYSVDADGNTVDLGVVAGAEDIVRPHTSSDQGQQVLTVVSVDSSSGTFADGVGGLVSSHGGTVYMTPDALYVGNGEDGHTDAGYSSNTRIERFAINGTDIAWQSSGIVPGTLINQFAMDEKDGHLRVVTHDDSSNDNGLYVLNTDTMEEVGRLTGLAPGEQLYAVRYVGNTAYLVTFLRTDPLFAVDVSDPTAPTLLGELEVPGFSNYLQSVGDGLLLGIGQERDAGSWNTHVHATLFDVSDPTAMTAVDREFLDPGYQWSWSDAQYDHHAVLYSEQDGLLVVPVAGSGYDPQTGYKSGQYLKVLRVTPNGIETIGEMHPGEPALRTVRIGDVLYAVGDTTVTAYRISDLSEIGSSAVAPSVV